MVYNIKDKFVSINGIKIINGNIIDNPFKLDYVRTQASQWVLLHEQEVKRQLRNYLYKVNKMGVSLDDCFVYCLDYFMKADKVFTESYGQDEEYSIRKYIMGNLKYVVTEYSRLLDDLPEDAYLTTEYEDTTNFKRGKLAFDSKVIQENKEYIDADYYNSLYEELVGHFKVFLKHKKYMDFDCYRFVYLFFIKPETDDLTLKIEHVSNELNIPEPLIELIIEDLKDSLHRDIHIDFVFKHLKEFIDVNKYFVPQNI